MEVSVLQQEAAPTPGLVLDRLPAAICKRIGDEPVGGHPLPFNNLLETLARDGVPVVVDVDRGGLSPQAPLTGDTSSGIGLRWLSTYHGRSTELTLGDPQGSETALAVWGDAEGPGRYTSLSLKGNILVDPHLQSSSTAPSGYIAYGLLESDSIRRSVRASRLLREAGVGTERIDAVFRPRHFIWRENGQATRPDPLTLDELRLALVQRHRKIHGKTESNKAAEALQKLSFLITARSMDTSTRLAELGRGPGQVYRNNLSKTFQLISLLHGNVFGDKSPENPEDVLWYYADFLPTAIGRNVGNLHRGLAHSFLHFGNFTALGSVIDLDSVHGEALDMGDEACTEADYTEDVNRVKTGFQDFLYAAPGRITYPNGMSSDDLKDRFQDAFEQSYLAARYTLADSTKPTREVITLAATLKDNPVAEALRDTLITSHFTHVLGEVPSIELLDPQQDSVLEELEGWCDREIPQRVDRQVRALCKGILRTVPIAADIKSDIRKHLTTQVSGYTQRLYGQVFRDSDVMQGLQDWIQARLRPSGGSTEEVMGLMREYLRDEVFAQTMDELALPARIDEALDGYGLEPSRLFNAQRKQGQDFMNPDLRTHSQQLVGRQIVDVVSVLKLPFLQESLRRGTANKPNLIVHFLEKTGGDIGIDLAPFESLQQLFMAGHSPNLRIEKQADGSTSIRFTHKLGAHYGYVVHEAGRDMLTMHLMAGVSASVKAYALARLATRRGFDVTHTRGWSRADLEGEAA